jgi:molybdopterin converting factor small subunit
MTVTIEELKEKLKLIDEVTLLEVLEINSHQIVEAFEDKIIEQYDALAEDLEDDTSSWD